MSDRCVETLRDHILSIGVLLGENEVTAACASNYEALVELAEIFRLMGQHPVYQPTQAIGLVMEYQLSKVVGNNAPGLSN